MDFLKTNFKGLFVIESSVFKDERGQLVETYKEDIFFKKFSFISTLELEVDSKKNVLRGMHYQLKPYAQAKIIRVLKGSVLDVVVDLRKNSATYGKNYSIILNDKEQKQLYVPEGFAHGYYVLSDTARVNYKMNNIYNKEYAKGIIYNDKVLNIDWGLDIDPILSSKDQNLPFIDGAITL
jgi:dTDP-4-dehydrorhamnose 3,5-epimerase